MRGKILRYTPPRGGNLSQHYLYVECPKIGKSVNSLHCERCEHLRIFTNEGVSCLYGLDGNRFTNNKNCSCVCAEYSTSDIDINNF